MEKLKTFIQITILLTVVAAWLALVAAALFM